MPHRRLRTLLVMYSFRYAFSIMFLILVLLVLGSVCVGLILGVAGFRVGHLPHERTSVSNFGGIWLLV